jgi:tetratricopeptide (TPR) repeat protein
MLALKEPTKGSPRMIRHLLSSFSVLALSTALTAPVLAQSVSGSYLAGRHAAVRSDYAAASRYYTDALARDPKNPELMESAALATLSLGEVAQAIPVARALENTGQSSQVAQLLLSADLGARGAYDALLARETAPSGIGLLVDGLVKAWAHLGKGDTDAAMAAFDTHAQQPGIGGFVMYHKALALASIGEFEAANQLFETGATGVAGNTRRAVLARAEILSQMGQPENAVTLIDTSFEGATDPELEAVLTQLASGEPLDITVVRDVRDGLAEVYFTFAAILRSEQAGDNYVLLYTQIAQFLRPSHIDALLLKSDLLERLEQFDLAIDALQQVPADNPAYHAAEQARASVMRRADRPDEAIEVLQQLARSHAENASVQTSLGDALRSQEDFEGAITAYDRALELLPQENPRRWVLYYSRGIAQERSGNWQASESDFRAALAINPEQPNVLNYLGYSMVEQQRNLDEALDMIERAVAANPDSGYIVDSLGWVLYRLGRYDEAVVQMEKAVQLLAVDPVVNDHLGDVY